MSKKQRNQKAALKKSIHCITKTPNSLIKEIEINKLKDGSAVVTLSFEDANCYAIKHALIKQFLGDACAPGYMEGSVPEGHPLHKELHQSINRVNKKGEHNVHYHLLLSKFKYVHRFLSDLRIYQLTGTLNKDREAARSFFASPSAFFHEPFESPSCLTNSLLDISSLEECMLHNRDVLLSEGVLFPRLPKTDCVEKSVFKLLPLLTVLICFGLLLKNFIDYLGDIEGQLADARLRPRQLRH